VPTSSGRLSRTVIDRAGDLLRRYRLGETTDSIDLGRAMDRLAAFRREWSDPPQPLATVIMGLRSMVETLEIPTKPTQRLKRMARIIDKLARYPTSRLTQMQDIGGCRVVVDTLGEVRALQKRLVEVWVDDIRHVDDYVGQPKPDGYRAIHMIVVKQQHLVEIQLRTRLQHEWATLVERLEGTLAARLREGEGEVALRDALQDLSTAASFGDLGQSVPPQLATRIYEALQRLREPG
jgi:hypothetical protein